LRNLTLKRQEVLSGLSLITPEPTSFSKESVYYFLELSFIIAQIKKLLQHQNFAQDLRIYSRLTRNGFAFLTITFTDQMA
jgi:hypothetical protein